MAPKLILCVLAGCASFMAACSEKGPTRANRSVPAPTVTDAIPAAASPTPRIQLKSFRIVIDSVKYVDGQVKVEATTDLPDGASVIVNFDVPKGLSEDRVGSDERVVVSKGKFRSSLVPKSEFPRSSPQVVEVMFTPRGQNPELVKLTGADGEYLTGENVSVIAGIKIIEVTKSVRLPIR